ncbi:MAG TPA: IS256 family transposase [Candidatus Acidoferrales bacterium]|nr:IS256 family transposase [Candidatus Acidoferrales bacterium]
MRVKNITQRFEGFVRDLQESFWGDFQGQTRQRLKELLEKDAEQQMLEYLGLKWHERSAPAERVDYRNGFYDRDYVTPLGVIRLRIPRTRLRSFLPHCIGPLQRRSPEVAELIRQAFLRGISTRQVGRVVAVVTGESVSAQTVSQLTRVLDQAVQAFHHRPLGDEWAYLFLDGVWLKVRRAFGPQRVLLLVAYGVRRDGQRELLAFTRAKGESQAAWEGLLNDLFRHGLRGRNLQLVVTDGCAGLARAIETVYPRVRHQRCWVHKMRNILEKVRRRDEAQVKIAAQKIYLAKNVAGARRAFERFRFHWRSRYPSMVRQLERDLPELLHFFALPAHLWRKVRTTNVIERCFVEVRRRTRPMVVFSNVESVERIIYAIFSRFNEDWKTHTLKLFTQAA